MKGKRGKILGKPKREKPEQELVCQSLAAAVQNAFLLAFLVTSPKSQSPLTHIWYYNTVPSILGSKRFLIPDPPDPRLNSCNSAIKPCHFSDKDSKMASHRGTSQSSTSFKACQSILRKSPSQYEPSFQTVSFLPSK